MLKKIVFALVLVVVCPAWTFTAEPPRENRYVNEAEPGKSFPYPAPRSKRFQPEDLYYLGLAGAIAKESFDHDDTYILGYKADYNNGFGGSARFGYRFGTVIDGVALSCGGELDYLTNFDWTERRVASELDVITGMAIFKASLEHPISPYAVLGIGVMHATADVSINPGNYDEDDSDTDFCTKFGLGADIFISRNFAVGFEGNYVMGLGDVENIRYFEVLGGFSFYM